VFVIVSKVRAIRQVFESNKKAYAANLKVQLMKETGQIELMLYPGVLTAMAKKFETEGIQ